ncbi:MAG: glycosyltransferase [Thermodesulfovibrionales bacterium]
MKKLIKKVFRKCGFKIMRYEPDPRGECVSLKPENRPRGSVLLALWIKPFLLKDGEPIPNSHAHYWRSLQIAKTFLDLGYSVDVIDYLNGEFIPEKNYAFFVSFRTHFERIARLLNEDCIKIAHLDTAHWLFNNSAAFRRGLALQQRRGVSLRGLRIVETNMAIECADYATLSGNQFTVDTYRYSQKPLFRVPYPSCAVYPWPEGKNFDSCRNNFLWFGSSGFVHKGLDLVLDVFANAPGYHLYVCGPIQDEKDFEEAYYKELYQTPNIHTLGWLDTGGPEFAEVARKCVGVVYFSCAEGGGGSAITCMHAGLIPIVSYESSVDVEDFGIVVKDSSPEEIRDSIQMISGLSAEKLQTMSRKAWEFVRANHTRERSAEEFRKVIEQITEYHCRSGKNKTAANREKHQLEQTSSLS